MNVNSNINDEEKVPLIQNEEPKQYKYPYASILFLMMVTIFSNQAYSGINAVLALYFSDVKLIFFVKLINFSLVVKV